MMCAHLDTVQPTARIEPVFRDSGWVNANAGILGADNKAAVAALIELARIMQATPEPAEVGLELVFTVCEEACLRGASAFDVGRLRSDVGFVFDHASPLGEVASPTHQRISALFTGRAAHAGIRPEHGRSAIQAAAAAIAAMRLGRLDENTTANIGTIAGGTGASTSSPSTAGSSARCAAWRTGLSTPHSPRWSTRSRTPPMAPSATST